MSKRQQLPPQIKKLEVVDRKTGKTVVRYQLTLDSGVNPLTGKRQQVRRRYATEKQARDALSEIGQQAASDMFVPRKAVTVDELCADWLASLHNARATTLNAYRYAVAPLRERHGTTPVQGLTRPQLDKLLIDLRDGGTMTAKGHARRAWSPRSLNKAVDAGARAGLRDRTPRARPQRRRRNEESSAHPSRDEHLHPRRDPPRAARRRQRPQRASVVPRAVSGLRRAEIAGLKWSDIDLGAGRSPSRATGCRRARAIVVEGDPKTLSSRRTLPLDDGLVAVLKRASARYAQERLALGAAHADSGYVAVNEAGQPYTPDTLTRKWHKLAKAAGVRPIRLHDARHSCGTALHLRGVPLAVIAKWLGHADAAITARIYAH